MTTTATKKTAAAPVTPPTFAEVAHRMMRERVERYRKYLKRQSEGEQLEDADLSHVAELLEGLGLPDFAWARDLEALQRHAMAETKFQTALDAEPANRQRNLELMAEIQTLQAKLAALLEDQRRAQAGSNKSTTYAHSIAVLAADHPVALADIDTAVTLRLEEMNRRKMGGVS